MHPSDDSRNEEIILGSYSGILKRKSNMGIFLIGSTRCIQTETTMKEILRWSR